MISSFKKNKWLSSFVIVILLFLLVNLFFFPLFNSGDDVFLMYKLSGGFGEIPTNLLHYDHIWHPILGWLVKSLFTFSPGINWYTIILMLFQIFGCAAILHVFSQRFGWILAIGMFIILFVFFEIRILLSLNFTSTSWVISAGGYLLLFQNSIAQKKIENIFFAAILLFLSGLLRLHILLIVTVLFLPSFLFYATRQYKTWAPVIVSVGVVLFLLNIEHKNFYKKNIPGWQSEENNRQTLFYAYNRPLHTNPSVTDVFGDSVTKAFYHNYFFFDTNFISHEKKMHIVRTLTRHRNFQEKEDRQVLYWTFMELRVYILLFFIIFFLLWKEKILNTVSRRWLISSSIVFVLYCYLFIFLKITESVFLGSLLLLWVFLCMAIPGGKFQTNWRERKFIYFVTLLLLPFLWMGIRIGKKEKDNHQSHQSFQCVVAGLKNKSDKLFITTDDALPLDHFYIWDPPSKYLLTNLIYKDMVINNCYQPILKRFEITDVMKSIYQEPNVFLLGRDFPELKEYYKQKENIDIVISQKENGDDCFRLTKASLAEK